MTNNGSAITVRLRKEEEFMNKNLIHFVIVGVIAGFCVSAKAAPSNQDNREIAMAKCTRDDSQKKNGNGKCSEDNNSQGDQSNASSQVKGKRKSAAQKVLYGK